MNFYESAAADAEIIYEDEPDIREPEALATYDIVTDGDNIIVYCWTNDNEDTGYPGRSESYTLKFSTLEAALRITGKSRQGVLCRVEVTVDGQKL